MLKGQNLPQKNFVCVTVYMYILRTTNTIYIDFIFHIIANTFDVCYTLGTPFFCKLLNL